MEERKKTEYFSNKKPGWFSKRYQTAAAHLKAKEVRLQRENEQSKASVQRSLERKQRTPQEQIALLNERLGKDIGAKKERARLHQQIANAKAPSKQEDSGPKKNRKSRKQRQRS